MIFLRLVFASTIDNCSYVKTFACESGLKFVRNILIGIICDLIFSMFTHILQDTKEPNITPWN